MEKLKLPIKDRKTTSFTNKPWFSAVLPLIVLFVLMSLIKPDTFLTTSNLMNILRQASTYAIMAVGMTFPIITGGIDISGGAITGLSCMVLALLQRDTGMNF